MVFVSTECAPIHTCLSVKLNVETIVSKHLLPIMDPSTKSTKTKSSSSSKVKKDEKHKDEKTKKDDKRKEDKLKKDDKHKDEPYSSDFLRQKLREYFNHSDFKSTLQKDAIKEIMKGTFSVCTLLILKSI